VTEDTATQHQPCKKNSFASKGVVNLPHDRLGNRARQIVRGNQPGDASKIQVKYVLQSSESDGYHGGIEWIQQYAERNGNEEQITTLVYFGIISGILVLWHEAMPPSFPAL
jgi:hypothetical protein